MGHVEVENSCIRAQTKLLHSHVIPLYTLALPCNATGSSGKWANSYKLLWDTRRSRTGLNIRATLSSGKASKQKATYDEPAPYRVCRASKQDGAAVGVPRTPIVAVAAKD